MGLTQWEVSLQIEKTSYGCWVTVESILRSLAEYCEEIGEGKCGSEKSMQHVVLVMPFTNESTVDEETQAASAVNGVAVGKYGHV